MTIDSEMAPGISSYLTPAEVKLLLTTTKEDPVCEKKRQRLRSRKFPISTVLPIENKASGYKTKCILLGVKNPFLLDLPIISQA